MLAAGHQGHVSALCGNCNGEFALVFVRPIFLNFLKKNSKILEELRQFCAKFHDFSMKIRGETIVQS